MSGVEKNWLFIPTADAIYAIYLTTETDQTILRIGDDGGVEDVTLSPALPWKWGHVHGGCVTRHSDGTLIHFFNSRTGGDKRERHRYQVGAALLDDKPPFGMKAISKEPILSGEEGACLDDNPRFKPNVVFSCGAIPHEKGWRLAYGFNDCEVRIATLKMEDLNL